MSWSQAENSSEDFSEQSQLSDSSVEGSVMNKKVLDDVLQLSARTDRAEIVQTAEVIMQNVSIDPEKNKPVRVGKSKKTKGKKKKKVVRNVWEARRNFLEGNYASVQEDSDIAGALCNLSLRKAASNVGLSILRSSSCSISFYPMGLPKKGNTVCTFSTSKRNPMWWTLTKTDVEQLLKNWETLAPSGTPTRRRKPVQWNEAGRTKLISMSQNIRNTRKMIADILNDKAVGSMYRSPDSRPYRAEDVTRELQRLFPREMDIHRMLWYLNDLQQQPGWRGLKYSVEDCQTLLGQTIKTLVITMPNAEELVKQYGNVVHADCTFGLLLSGQKTMGLVVVDGENKARVLSVTSSPGHTQKDWEDLFNRTAHLTKRAKAMIVHCDGEVQIKTAFYTCEVFSKKTKQTGAWHSQLSSVNDKSESGAIYGQQAAKKFHYWCAPASCEAEFRDKCERLATQQEREGQTKQAEITRKKCDNNEGYWNWTPVMMNGKLATGIIECVWTKMKGVGLTKRSLTLFTNAVLRVACEMSDHPEVCNECVHP